MRRAALIAFDVQEIHLSTSNLCRNTLAILGAATLVAASPRLAEACTRALYVAKDGTVIVGRSIDWGEDMHSNMWVLPRGMKRDGRGGKNTIAWESKYGKPAEGAKVISLSTWPQYVLDSFANVADAVADLRKENFRVQTVVLGTGRPANMHLVISDASGDSAVFEYVGGTSKSLPGTSRAADRFVRASFLLDVLPGEVSPTYISGTPEQSFKFQAPMAVLSLMRSVGTPLGFANEDQPWVSSTIWRTVSDSTNRVVIFDSALTPATFWVKLDELDLKPGAPVKKLHLAGGESYSGNALAQFVAAPLFTFQDLTDVAPAK